LTVIITKNCS